MAGPFDRMAGTGFCCFFKLGEYFSLVRVSDGFGAAFPLGLGQSDNPTDIFYSQISRTAPTPTPAPTATPTPRPKVTGGGQITGDPIFSALGDLISSPAAILSAGGTDNANFGFVIEDGSPPSGNLQYHDHGTGDVIKVTSYDLLLIAASTSCAGGQHAKFTGSATVNGVANQPLTVEVDDCGEPGTADMFGITTTGYTNGPKTLLGGNIQVHK